MDAEQLFIVHSFLAGAQIGAVYDVLRILRRVFPHRKLAVSAEDLLFWIGTAAEVFLLLYRENNGQLRWYAVMVAGLGLYLYERLLGRYGVKWFSFLLIKGKHYVQHGLTKMLLFLKRGLTKLHKLYTIIFVRK